jgi:chromosome segregation ATPase
VYHLDVKAQREELAAITQRVEEVNREVKRRAIQLIPRKQENLDLQSKIDQIAAIGADKETLSAQIPVLELRLAEVTRDFVDAVTQVRAATLGMAWPSVQLRNGQVLSGVTIQKITDSDLTLNHDQGTVRIAARDLPADLRDRLRIEESPMTRWAAIVESGAELPAAASASGSPETSAGGGVSLTPAQLARISHTEANVSRYETRKTELHQTKQAYLVQVADYRRKDEIAYYTKKPQKYKEVIPQIVQAINRLDEQIAELATKIATLQIEVANIKEGVIP